jgi:predicted ThiF/HesA family dinucleotide-utilizing enzyme
MRAVLVDLEAGAESDLRVVGVGHLGERLEIELIFAHRPGPFPRTRGAL